MFSRLIAVLFLCLLSPIIIVVALIIVLDDGFPLIFRQTRFGINCSKFNIFKFRTMKKDTPDIPTHQITDAKSLLIRSGYFIRKMSLDELPQLLNIIIGDMVFIGPRPALYNQKDLITLRENCGVNGMKPGITGWAQVNGRDTLTIEQKVFLESFYYEKKSIMLDIKIIYLTIIQLIKRDDIKH